MKKKSNYHNYIGQIYLSLSDSEEKNTELSDFLLDLPKNLHESSNILQIPFSRRETSKSKTLIPSKSPNKNSFKKRSPGFKSKKLTLVIPDPNSNNQIKNEKNFNWEDIWQYLINNPLDYHNDFNQNRIRSQSADEFYCDYNKIIELWSYKFVMEQEWKKTNFNFIETLANLINIYPELNSSNEVNFKFFFFFYLK